MAPRKYITAGDPKFWPSSVKYAVLGNLCVFVFMGNMYSASLSPGFLELAMEFQVDFTKLIDLISYSVLTLGLGNLFWTPVGMLWGKRPAIILSMVMFLAGSIWSSTATSFDSLLGARVFASLGGSSIESLGPSIIADMFAERHFATAMAVFAVCLAGGAQVGPMIGGYLIAAKGWQWLFILVSIITAINIVTTIFGLPETSWKRVMYDGETAAEVDKEATDAFNHLENSGEKGQASLTHFGTQQEREDHCTSYWQDLWDLKNRAIEDGGIRAFPRVFSLPFRFMLVPGAAYAAISFGVFIGGITVISALSPLVLGGTPYLFGPIEIGLLTAASFLGNIISYPIAGPFTDWLSRTITKRNNNEHQPEHRIPALIVPFLVCPPGLILFAWTVAQGGSVYVIGVGMAMFSASLSLVPSVMLSYVVDAYPRTGPEALVLVNAFKNAVAFGFVRASGSWFAAAGLTNLFAELAGIQWAVLLLAIPLYFGGKWMRAKTLHLV